MTIVNVEQSNAWNGVEGETWAAEWESYDRSIAAYRGPMLDAAAISDGEHVLDVGCGNGQSTCDAATRTPAGRVLGLDLSGPMLARARARARSAGLVNVEFVQGDAQVHPLEPAAFDVVISRFGSMFFADRVAAYTNIGSALRPGGRLLFVVWQPLAKNEQFVTMTSALAAGRELPPPPPGAPSPFALADPEVGRQALEAAGFVDVRHDAVELPFVLGPTAHEAYEFAHRQPMLAGLLRDLDEPTRESALDTLRQALVAHESPDGVVFSSATWFITARRP